MFVSPWYTSTDASILLYLSPWGATCNLLCVDLQSLPEPNVGDSYVLGKAICKEYLSVIVEPTRFPCFMCLYATDLTINFLCMPLPPLFLTLTSRKLPSPINIIFKVFINFLKHLLRTLQNHPFFSNSIAILSFKKKMYLSVILNLTYKAFTNFPNLSKNPLSYEFSLSLWESVALGILTESFGIYI